MASLFRVPWQLLPRGPDDEERERRARRRVVTEIRKTREAVERRPQTVFNLRPPTLRPPTIRPEGPETVFNLRPPTIRPERHPETVFNLRPPIVTPQASPLALFAQEMGAKRQRREQIVGPLSRQELRQLGAPLVREFGAAIRPLGPVDRAELSRLKRALERRGLSPNQFRRMLREAALGDEEKRAYLLDIRNEVAPAPRIGAPPPGLTVRPPPPEERHAPRFSLPGLDTLRGLGGGLVDLARGTGQILSAMNAPEQTLREIGEAGVELIQRPSLEELREAGREIGGVARENITELWEGVERLARGEQRVVGPLVRPFIAESLRNLGVPEPAIDWVDRNISPFIVPSTFVGVSKGPQIGRGLVAFGSRVGLRGLVEGTINMIQGDAAAEVQGRKRGDWERAIDFVGGGLAAGLLPEVAETILRRSAPSEEIAQATLREMQRAQPPVEPAPLPKTPSEQELPSPPPERPEPPPIRSVDEPDGISREPLSAEELHRRLSRMLERLRTETTVERAPTSAPPAVPGRALDPNTRQEIRMAAIRWRLQRATGESVAQAIYDATLAGQRRYLQLDADNLVGAVEDTGLSREANDVLSRPDAYVWKSPEARAWADTYAARIEALSRLLEENGIRRKLELAPGERYIHRVVIEYAGEPVRIGPRGRIGARQSFLRPRVHELAGEAGAAERRYADPATAIRDFYEGGFRQIADRDWVQTIARFGETPSQRIPREIKEASAEARLRVRAARREFQREQIARPRATEQRIRQAERSVEQARRKLAVSRARRNKKAIASAQEELTRAREELAQARALRKEDRAALKARREELKLLQAEANLRRGERARAMEIARQPKPTERFILEPGLGGRIFPREVAEETERSLRTPEEGVQSSVAKLLDFMGDVNNIFRPIWASTDLSFSALQLAPMLGSNPGAWAETMAIALRSAVDPDVYYHYVSRHLDDFLEMIEDGVPVSQSEFTFAQALRGPYRKQVERMLAVLKPMKIGADLFDRALNIAAHHQYRQGRAILDEVGESAMRNLLRRSFGAVARGPDARRQLGAVIAHGIGRFSLPESSRMGPMLTKFAGALPFAGRYWVAWAKLLVDASRLGIRGNLARRYLLGWAAIAIGLYSFVAWSLGQTPNLRLDDRESIRKFMTIEVGGKRIGFGGALQQFLVFAARIANDPKAAHEITARFLRGKAAPVISFLVDLVSEETYTGKPLDSWKARAEYIVSRLVPFAAQETVMELASGKPGEALERLKEAPASITGLRAFPMTPQERFAEFYEAKYGHPPPEGISPWQLDAALAERAGIPSMRESAFGRERAELLRDEEARLRAALEEGGPAQFANELPDYFARRAGITDAIIRDFDLPERASDLVRRFYELRPQDHRLPDGSPDWEFYDAERERILERLRAEGDQGRRAAEALERGAYETFSDPKLEEAYRFYRRANELRRRYFEITPVLGADGRPLSDSAWKELRQFWRASSTILDVVRQTGEPLSSEELAERTGMPIAQAEALIAQVRQEGPFLDAEFEDAARFLGSVQGRSQNFIEGAIFYHSPQNRSRPGVRNPEADAFLSRHEAELRPWFGELYGISYRRRIAQGG